MISVQYDERGFSVSLNGTRLLAHTKAEPCVYIGRAVEHVDMYRGNFDISDRIEERLGLGDFSIDESGGSSRITLSRGFRALADRAWPSRCPRKKAVW